MSWFHCGKGDYEQVTISDESNSRTVSHIVTPDTKYGDGETKIVTETYDSGSQVGHTTIHGNDHVNYHDGHQDFRDSD